METSLQKLYNNTEVYKNLSKVTLGFRREIPNDFNSVIQKSKTIKFFEK